MEIRPVGKRILIKQAAPPQTYGGGLIYIPDSQREDQCKGTVIAIGNEVKDAGQIKKGDYIQYADYIKPIEMQHDGETHLIITQGDVLAVIVV
jgi:co-chaperonin GroES (HSP10)